MRNVKAMLSLLMILCFSFSLQAGVHHPNDKIPNPPAASSRTAGETLMNLEHNTGNLRVAIFNDGSIGADNVTFAGPGISWKGQNGAFTGGLVFGSTQRGIVNGLMGFSLNANVLDAQNLASNFAAGFQPATGFNQTTSATLNDVAAPLPYGVEILQRSYSNTGEDFVIIRYGFVNKSGGELTDFFAGVHVDWDVGTATTNSGGSLSGDRGQNSLVAHFGLGDATIIDSLRLEWPSGQIDHFTNLAINRFLTVEEGGIISGIKQQQNASLPRDFALEQNYPNPFNPTTRIAFALPVASRVTLTVFDVNGRIVTELIRDQHQAAGRHEVGFIAQNLASGNYHYKLEATPNNGGLPRFIETKTMIYLK